MVSGVQFAMIVGMHTLTTLKFSANHSDSHTMMPMQLWYMAIIMHQVKAESRWTMFRVRVPNLNFQNVLLLQITTAATVRMLE